MTPVRLLGSLHRLTHRMPGVPEHTDRPNGHHGRHPSTHRHPAAHNHPAARPPRVLVAWQTRIAHLLDRQSR